MSIFEITMLICFGAGWPASVYRTYRTRSSRGKSLLFLSLVFIGYISGCLHKVIYHYDAVVFLYILNGLFVLADLILSTYYRRQET